MAFIIKFFGMIFLLLGVLLFILFEILLDLHYFKSAIKLKVFYGVIAALFSIIGIIFIFVLS